MKDEERVRFALYDLLNDGFLPNSEDVSVWHLAEIAAGIITELRAENARLTEYCGNYEKHIEAIADLAGVRLNGSEHQWSEATRAILSAWNGRSPLELAEAADRNMAAIQRSLAALGAPPPADATKPEDRFTASTMTPLERARFAIQAGAPNRDLLTALVGEIDRLVAMFAHDAELFEAGRQHGIRHAASSEALRALAAELRALKIIGWTSELVAIADQLEALAGSVASDT